MKKEAKVWLDQAQKDLDMMEFCFIGHRYGYSAYFAQQCVEKVIKSYIIERFEIVPPKIHFIEKLMVEAHLDLAEINSPDVSVLSKVYASSRYPDMRETHFESRKNTEAIVQLARKLYIWIEKKLLQS